MEWGTIGMWVAVALALWFAWQTYLEHQARTAARSGLNFHAFESAMYVGQTDISLHSDWQMEAAALRAARDARERWTIPAQDMNLTQVR